MFLPSVLIPSFDLGIREIEFCRQFLSILNTQILLLLKTSLQSLELVICKGCSGLPLLPGVHLATSRSIFRRATIFI